jgi:signal transduction histidine kinase/ActR/RegA family two-component response regulator
LKRWLPARKFTAVYGLNRLLQSLITETSPIADNLLKLLSQWMRDSTLRIVRDRAHISELADHVTEAEQANTAKSKFLAAVSHDLRQPIHAQGLFLGALSLTKLDAHQQEILTNASAASKSSVEMLNTLLDFSRIEAGVIEPNLQPFRLQPLLNKIEREFGSQADIKGITYRSRETTLAVQSDPMLVELILRNLVSNAIRYTERGGVLVTCRKHGSGAALEVWDTGIGIAPSHQQLVFREFLQLANPERDRQKGLGLGLAIVHGLARTLKHNLSLSSTPGRGSVFRLLLPIATVTLPDEAGRLAEPEKQLLEMRVLVVEDDEIVRNGMRILLNNWGCECDAAGSIEEALDLARMHTPDLIICDYRLREHRTGIEAIKALRALLGNELPALLITGDTAPDRLREALVSGIPILHKPVAPDQLYQSISTIRSGQIVSN